MNKQLEELNKKLESAYKLLIKSSEKEIESEREFKIMRAKHMFSEEVRHLPNQQQRESKIEELMSNDDIYRNYKQVEFNRRKAWYYFDLLKELSSNTRTIINSTTFGGDKNE